MDYFVEIKGKIMKLDKTELEIFLLCNPLFIHSRRMGNNTRQVDYLIQKLFIKGEIIFAEEELPMAPGFSFSKERHNEMLYNILKKRIESEHENIYFDAFSKKRIAIQGFSEWSKKVFGEK